MTTTADQLDDSLLTMSGCAGQTLVTGETSDLTSSNLGMRTSLIDATLMGATGLTIGSATASSSGLPADAAPGMTLPATFQFNESVSVASINYGNSNPYEASGGPIGDGASVNSFTINGLEVGGLSKDNPIILNLPLQASRRRQLRERRLGN